MNGVIDVETGEAASLSEATVGAFSGSHQGDDEWWVVANVKDDDKPYAEVCLASVNDYHWMPLWPILQVPAADADLWAKRLCAFATTLDLGMPSKHYDDKYNGDRRLGEWLEECGFRKASRSAWRLDDVG